MNPQSKDSDYSHLKVEGKHCSLDGGCHGFLSKAFGIMAHPTSDVSTVERGESREQERGRGRDEGKGKGREGKEGTREGGRKGGQGRQPVAHHHQITSSYSTSLVPVQMEQS